MSNESNASSILQTGNVPVPPEKSNGKNASPEILAAAPEMDIQTGPDRPEQPAAAAEPTEPTGSFLVQRPDEDLRRYDPDALARAIRIGEVVRTDRARPEGVKGDWSTVEQIAASRFALKVLYKPLWAHIGRGFTYGALIGIGLKTLETDVMLFVADPTGAAGLVFLLVVVSLFLTRYFTLAPALAVFISIKAGFTANFFFMFLGAAFVGVLFGGPAGALIGSIIGHFRKNSLAKASDYLPEGRSPYLWGMLAPAIFLAVAIPLYWFWFMPKAASWISAAH